MNVRLRALLRYRFTFALVLAAWTALAGVCVAAVPPVPPALAAALVRDPDVTPCFHDAHVASAVAYTQANFQFSNVTLTGGPALVVVQGGGACVCGNANCKLDVFRRNGDAYVSVLDEYAIEADVRPDGTAVIASHDSAAVSYRTTYHWNGNRYAQVKNEIVLEDPKTVKLASRSVQFATGASSTTLRGDRVVEGYPDEFDFDAAAGQTVTLTLVAHDDHFGTFSLVTKDDAPLATARTGSLTFTLPKSGTYRVEVDGADQTFTKYALVLRIL